MKSFFAISIIISTVGFLPFSQAMTMTQVDQCLESDLARLEGSRNFKDFVSNAQMSGTDLKLMIEDFSMADALTIEDLKSLKKFKKNAELAITVAKSCEDIAVQAKRIFEFEKEYNKTVGDLLKNFRKYKKEQLDDLKSVGLIKAAETLTEKQLFIISTLQSEMLIYSLASPAAIIKEILSADFTDLTQALDLVQEDFENEMAELQSKMTDKDYDTNAEALRVKRDKQFDKINKAIAARASTYKAEEIEAVLLKEAIQQKTTDWKRENQ